MIKLRQVLILVFVVFGFVSSLTFAQGLTPDDLVNQAKSEIKEVTVKEANELLDKSNVVFLDVREAYELKDGFVPGSINIPRGELEFKIEKAMPDKDKDIVVYCRTGRRSSLATQTLFKMGYKKVMNLKDGFMGWVSGSYPVESPDK